MFFPRARRFFFFAHEKSVIFMQLSLIVLLYFFLIFNKGIRARSFYWYFQVDTFFPRARKKIANETKLRLFLFVHEKSVIFLQFLLKFVVENCKTRLFNFCIIHVKIYFLSKFGNFF